MKQFILPLAMVFLAFNASAATIVTTAKPAPLMLPAQSVTDTAQPAVAAPAKTARVIDNSGMWTKEQLDKLCYYRAAGNAREFDNCLKHNAHRLGKAKQPGEMMELNSADQQLTQKANERVKQMEPKQPLEEMTQ